MSTDAASNRRLGPRRFAGVKVMVTHPSLGLVKCRLRDIGLDGAFIEISDPDLKPGADVDLVVKVRTAKGHTHCRLPAKIMRITDKGAALSFGELEERAYQTLFDIVHMA